MSDDASGYVFILCFVCMVGVEAIFWREIIGRDHGVGHGESDKWLGG